MDNENLLNDAFVQSATKGQAKYLMGPQARPLNIAHNGRVAHAALQIIEKDVDEIKTRDSKTIPVHRAYPHSVLRDAQNNVRRLLRGTQTAGALESA